MKVCSFAKINLHLAITGKRSDGYHDIETIFQEIDFCDYMEFTPSSELSLSSNHPGLPLNEENLIIKAARLLSEDKGCHIHIEKRIPMGAGLGGGSSNAAATLLALNTLWDRGLSPEQLHTLAAQLGSDIPFFIIGGTAWARGRGERIHPLTPGPGYYGVLFMPDIHISTAWAYQNSKFILTKREKNLTLPIVSDVLNRPDAWKDLFFNDLEPIALKKYPLLHKIIATMYDSGAFYAHMTGSGSTIFGLFTDREQARRAADKCRDRGETTMFRPVIDRNQSISSE
ncbi:4-(cytidine 5'-diphospho)-2-C-methyl-D-erythritol kinase [candidate division KSB1 bacterium]|nr:4-(cytidine 5'-diphospho)-2-C-methyl-D-erythritol kinase [candidate division KSB1 bacterium]